MNFPIWEYTWDGIKIIIGIIMVLGMGIEGYKYLISILPKRKKNE